MSEDRPAGYYSREARAQRSAVWQSRRAVAAERREAEDRDRQQRDCARDLRLQPIHAYAANRLAALPPRALPPAVDEKPLNGRPTKALKRTKAGKAAAKKARKAETIKEKWRHKNEGTPETHEKASHVRQGALVQLHLAGDIDADQLAWSMEIATVAEQIQSDVEVRTASWETRVDNSGRAKDPLIEGIRRVRHHLAYDLWRSRLQQPKRAAMDMILGEPIPFSTAARRYRMGRIRAKKLLIDALDLWPECVNEISKKVDPASLAACYAGLSGG